MTKEETIKVLQSIENRAVDFPNMTACDWVAIAAAKRHLSDDKIKNIDLEEELHKWKQKHFDGIGYVLDGEGGWIGITSLFDIAEYFFELGLNTQKGE